MPRRARSNVGGYANHVLNRANGRLRLFRKDADFEVERNPLRAGLVQRAEDWRWSSLYRRLLGAEEERAILTESPVPLGRKWADYVNQPQSEAELEAIRRSVQRGQPHGDEAWTAKVTKKLGLEPTFRPRGRPRQAI